MLPIIQSKTRNKTTILSENNENSRYCSIFKQKSSILQLKMLKDYLCNEEQSQIFRQSTKLTINFENDRCDEHQSYCQKVKKSYRTVDYDAAESKDHRVIKQKRESRVLDKKESHPMAKFLRLSDLVKGQATEIKDYTRKSKKSLANKLLFFKVR